MDLLPIRIVTTEGPLERTELFFIDRNKFSEKYFTLNIAPLLCNTPEREDQNICLQESMLSRVYTEIETQIRKYSADLSRAQQHFPKGRVPVEIDFKLQNILRIRDQVVFRLPVDRVPEIYARDLFYTYGLSNGELQNTFVFYIKEQILDTIRKTLHNKKDTETTIERPTDLPLTETLTDLPKIEILSELDTIKNANYIYHSIGRVTIQEQSQEKRRKKKEKNISLSSYS
ncbi:hypothetical protein NEOKW01_1630 [Nematocida sp. AWRm80]|nr:hypothetical protein NEOKW01_1630 [Nematocida sp. AWRm80]